MDRDSNIRSVIDLLGYDILPSILTAAEIQDLIHALGTPDGAGIRGVLDIPEVAALAASARLRALLSARIPGTLRPVRAIYFDKSPRTNWSVGWHQDLTLAVKAMANAPGFGQWSIKDGIPHVQAPANLLEQMITIRLHLDDCDDANGALRVLVGSHCFGRLSPADIKRMSLECPEYTCRVPAGGAMLMRPLLLHCSKRSQVNRHRRVLHIEYAGFDLPEPLEWR